MDKDDDLISAKSLVQLLRAGEITTSRAPTGRLSCATTAASERYAKPSTRQIRLQGTEFKIWTPHQQCLYCPALLALGKPAGPVKPSAPVCTTCLFRLATTSSVGQDLYQASTPPCSSTNSRDKSTSNSSTESATATSSGLARLAEISKSVLTLSSLLPTSTSTNGGEDCTRTAQISEQPSTEESPATSKSKPQDNLRKRLLESTNGSL